MTPHFMSRFELNSDNVSASIVNEQDALEEALTQLNGRSPEEKVGRVASVLLLTDGSHNESRFSYKKLDPLVAESKCSGVYWCVEALVLGRGVEDIGLKVEARNR